LRGKKRWTNARTTPAAKQTTKQPNGKKSRSERQTQSRTADRPKKQTQRG
jgi:hypothetical protein